MTGFGRTGSLFAFQHFEGAMLPCWKPLALACLHPTFMWIDTLLKFNITPEKLPFQKGKYSCNHHVSGATGYVKTLGVYNLSCCGCFKLCLQFFAGVHCFWTSVWNCFTFCNEMFQALAVLILHDVRSLDCSTSQSTIDFIWYFYIETVLEMLLKLIRWDVWRRVVISDIVIAGVVHQLIHIKVSCGCQWLHGELLLIQPGLCQCFSSWQSLGERKKKRKWSDDPSPSKESVFFWNSPLKWPVKYLGPDHRLSSQAWFPILSPVPRVSQAHLLHIRLSICSVVLSMLVMFTLKIGQDLHLDFDSICCEWVVQTSRLASIGPLKRT